MTSSQHTLAIAVSATTTNINISSTSFSQWSRRCALLDLKGRILLAHQRKSPEERPGIEDTDLPRRSFSCCDEVEAIDFTQGGVIEIRYMSSSLSIVLLLVTKRIQKGCALIEKFCYNSKWCWCARRACHCSNINQFSRLNELSTPVAL